MNTQFSQSESVKNISGSLVAAQDEIGHASANSYNKFTNSSYADLGAHIEVVRPAFQKNGLAIIQFPSGTGGVVGVTTRVVHVSGEWMQTTIEMPLFDEKGKSRAQVAGSIISYLRRYSIAAVAGIYTGGDDDGGGQHQQSQERSRQQTQTQSKSGGKKKKRELPNVLKWLIESKAAPDVPSASGMSNRLGLAGMEKEKVVKVGKFYRSLRDDGVEASEAFVQTENKFDL